MSIWLVIYGIEARVLDSLLEVERFLRLAHILTVHWCQLKITPQGAIVITLHLHALTEHLLLLLVLLMLKCLESVRLTDRVLAFLLIIADLGRLLGL